MEALFAATAAGVRPDAAALERVVPYVKRFFDTAVRDGFGCAMGLTREQAERAALHGDFPADEAATMARQIAGHLNGEDPTQVMVELAAGAIAAGRPLPPSIAPAASAMLRGTWAALPRRGPDPYEHDTRDFLVTICVDALCLYGFKQTRNAASERKSACSIVAELSGLSEATVVKIAAKRLSVRRAGLLEK